LTCDFWAENGERKTTAKTRATESVASRFGLRSGLRQRGVRWRGWLGCRALKPGSISTATAKAIAIAKAKQVATVPQRTRPEIEAQKIPATGVRSG